VPSIRLPYLSIHKYFGEASAFSKKANRKTSHRGHEGRRRGTGVCAQESLGELCRPPGENTPIEKSIEAFHATRLLIALKTSAYDSRTKHSSHSLLRFGISTRLRFLGVVAAREERSGSVVLSVPIRGQSRHNAGSGRERLPPYRGLPAPHSPVTSPPRSTGEVDCDVHGPLT
jgi:hypothetical protein